jgi:DNA-binding transcriptional LysR family regulator
MDCATCATSLPWPRKRTSGAAARLHISQPPLTRQIQQLEEELGVTLFTRTPRGMELTQAGELFLEEARNIRALVEQATERTQRAGQGKLGRLDVAIFGSAILDAIPKLLLAFRNRHPDVKVVLHTMTKAEQIEALRQRRISVGFNRMLAPSKIWRPGRSPPRNCCWPCGRPSAGPPAGDPLCRAAAPPAGAVPHRRPAELHRQGDRPVQRARLPAEDLPGGGRCGDRRGPGGRRLRRVPGARLGHHLQFPGVVYRSLPTPRRTSAWT